MGEWKECELDKIASVQTGPFGSQLKNEQYVSDGTPVVTVEHVKDFRVLDFSYPSVTENDRKRLERYHLNKGDIVFTRVGSVDLSAFIAPHQDGWLFSSRMLRVRIKDDGIYSRYLSYYFQKPSFREYIKNIAVGATMPSINTEILSNVPVAYPPLNEQRAIAEVLSSLDDKIDLLHRQNKTLEGLAETLFRQMFIENAKDEWEDKPLTDLIDLIGGGTPKTSVPEYWEGGDIPWLSGGDIANCHKSIQLTSEKTITKEGLDKSSAKLLPCYSTVISARGTVGKYSLLCCPMAFSQSNYGILPKIENCYFFTYLLINHVVRELESGAYGSVFDTITTKTFNEVNFKTPLKNYILDFENLVAPYFEKKIHCTLEVRNLENLRDTLLPKLMSGEVRVKYEEA